MTGEPSASGGQIPSGLDEGGQVLVTRHVPVLVREVLEGLGVERGGSFLDCTLGGGGHSSAILGAHPNASIVAVDRDLRAVVRARARFQEEDRIAIHHGRFGDVGQIVGVSGDGEFGLATDAQLRFDGVLADLGMSTDQLVEGRGFSFRDAGSLDMRMDEGEGVTAASIINSSSIGELIRILRIGGVGREVSRISHEIVRARPIQSGQILADLVARVVPRTPGGSHPATVVFQALRIAVNREWEEIELLLRVVPRMMKPGGRLAIICFHSLEDQRVTRRLRQWAAGDTAPASRADMRKERPIGRLLTKSAIEPRPEEVEANPASRSARLRVFEFF